MGEIFINYRRDDTAGEARALFNELRERVGDNAVFMDVDNIALGRDFREVLTERARDWLTVMLALIGINWLDAKDKSGRAAWTIRTTSSGAKSGPRSSATSRSRRSF
jgi:hypothetical protein